MEPSGRGVGVAAGRDGQFQMVAGIVAGRVDGETAGRAVFEALVHRQDHQPAGAAQFAVVEETGQIGQCAGIIAAVPA